MKALDRKFCVAPMMQYTDMHDRFLLRLISKTVFLYTEMVATGSLIYGKCFVRDVPGFPTGTGMGISVGVPNHHHQGSMRNHKGNRNIRKRQESMNHQES